MKLHNDNIIFNPQIFSISNKSYSSIEGYNKREDSTNYFANKLKAGQEISKHQPLYTLQVKFEWRRLLIKTTKTVWFQKVKQIQMDPHIKMNLIYLTFQGSNLIIVCIILPY